MAQTDPCPFGALLRRSRRAAGLTQEELAARAQLSSHAISQLERGVRQTPQRATVELLVTALGLTGVERAAFEASARASRGEVLSRADVAMPAPLPAGTVTFLLTDIEGSTTRWEQHPRAMPAALARHDALLQKGITAHGGIVVTERGEGDSFFALFAQATDALAAACAVQQALAAEPWPPEIGPLRVRMALHTGEAGLWDGRDYRGAAVNRCARLRAAAHGGQILLSGVTYELVRDHLPAGVTLRDLGLHRLKDLTHPEHIFEVLLPGLPADFPPLQTLEAQRHNLPVQLTSFVGRTREMREVSRLLDETRLLTLTGPGGTGKTRLALQVAAERVASYPDGIWLVELAPLADPAQVSQALATVLGLRDDAGRPLISTLTEALHARRLLLVLDNCEHLLDVCAALADTLLHACPHMQILATSREALGIAGETSWRVPSLAFPDPARLPTLDTLAGAEAVRLFVERARAVQPHFTLTEQTAAPVAQVCQRLDGIPLALELAAARLRSLAVEQLAARLDQRFRLLTGGSRTALPRQQTLQATVDWSYSLLTPPEQILFGRLSVFVGGFTLEAAEAICSGGAIAADDVLDLLTRLVDKSLVTPHDAAGGEERYGLLETLRQYGRERLVAQGDVVAVHERHGRYYLTLAEEAEAGTHGAEQARWFDRLTAEHANLRAAALWLAETNDVEAALRLAAALVLFWEVRGLRRQGRTVLDPLLDHPAAQGLSRVRLKALALASIMAHFDYDRERVVALTEEALALGRSLDDPWSLGLTLLVLGLQAQVQHDLEQARRLFTEALTQLRQTTDRWLMAYALSFLGFALVEERPAGRRPAPGPKIEAARALFEESLALRRALGDRQGTADGLRGLARVRYIQGDRAGAKDLLHESLGLWHAVGDRANIFWVDYDLGSMALEQGETEQARRHFAAALVSAREIGDMAPSALALEGLAAVRAPVDPAGALRLVGAAVAIRAQVVQTLEPMEHPAWVTPLEHAQQALGPEAAAAAIAVGRGWTLEQASVEAVGMEAPREASKREQAAL